MKPTPFSPTVVRALFDYNPETGVLTHKARPVEGNSYQRRVNLRHNRYTAGTRAGHVGQHGYRVVRADGRSLLEHRVAWAIMTRMNPDDTIDHINGDKADNRWANLRCVPHSVNVKNQHGVYTRNPLGIANVMHSINGRLRVVVQHKHVGYYDTIDEAIVAARTRREELGMSRLACHYPLALDGKR